jgi:ubiquinone/menaquinone biosynthesis C-methylase UbiE
MNLSTVQKRLLAWGMAKANEADASRIELTGYPGYSNLAALKQAFLGNLQGKVLEIGPGAGANLSYYPKEIHWIGIEPNPFMFTYLKEEAKRQGIKTVEFHQGVAEQLPVEDNSIETVVSTHVLCSVRDLQASLQEINRVLKLNGRFIFIEHVAGECGTWTRRVQDKIEPVWKALFDNCHPNRETEKVLETTGFVEVNYQQFKLSFPVVSPHIAGVAIKTSVPSNLEELVTIKHP